MFLFIACVTAFLTGFIKAGFGIGAAVVTPMLSLIIPPKTAVALMAIIFIFSDAFNLYLYKNKWEIKLILTVLPGFLTGVVVGAYYLAWASPELTKLTIGIIAALFSLYQFAKYRYPAMFTNLNIGLPTAVAMSMVAGVISAIAHAGGLIVTIFLVTKNLGKQSFVATLSGILLVSDAIKILLYMKLDLISGFIALTGLEATVFLLMGSFLGGKINNRLSDKQFILSVNTLLLASGVVLIINR